MRHDVAAAALALAAFFVVDATGSAAGAVLPLGRLGQLPALAAAAPRRAAPSRATSRGRRTRRSSRTLPKPTGPLADRRVARQADRHHLRQQPEDRDVADLQRHEPEHETPTGIFTILEKNRYHYSNLYGGAPMPFMQRITNSGVALHEGVLPGYPASHGCIRLPGSLRAQPVRHHRASARASSSPRRTSRRAEFDGTHIIEPLPPDDRARQRTPAARR